MNGVKQWQCRNGHVMGMICWNGDGIPQLELYRHAVDLNADRPAEVDVIGPIQGFMPVRCDVCEDVQVWEISAEVMLSLYERLEGRRLQAFLEKVRKRGNPQMLKIGKEVRDGDSNLPDP